VHKTTANGFKLGRILGAVLVGVTGAAIVCAQPADVRSAVRAWIGSHQSQIVRELLQLLAIPNVASDRANIRKNAEHLRAMLARRGFSAELLETPGNPLVYGELKAAAPDAGRALLIYAHYDGQPVDPKGWQQPDPFIPLIRTGRLDKGGELVSPTGASARYEDDWRIYARSAADDKAPIVALLAAVDALKAHGIAPKVHLRVILDGEEEAGSPSLVPAIARYRDKLRADAMVILDGPMHSTGRPTVVYGARGIVTFNLTVFGPKTGVHSGNYGNWIPNPAQRLASLLASMKHDDGRVAVAGFYDGVVQPGAEERAHLGVPPDDAAAMLETFGVAQPEQAFPTLSEALLYPTLNVRGLSSAHVGAQSRTIIPDRATAAIDVRLVKETPAAELVEKIRAHIRARGFQLVDGDPDDDTRARYPRIARMEVSPATAAFRTPPLDPEARRLADALHRFFDEPPVQIRTLGGTVPIAPFIEALGFPAVLVPTVNFDNNQHEENENVRIGHLLRAIEIVAALLGA
jgi:acetylornithine deacetylase/succinyl-diaminopimelate desuccinylase-like protein